MGQKVSTNEDQAKKLNEYLKKQLEAKKNNPEELIKMLVKHLNSKIKENEKKSQEDNTISKNANNKVNEIFKNVIKYLKEKKSVEEMNKNFSDLMKVCDQNLNNSFKIVITSTSKTKIEEAKKEIKEDIETLNKLKNELTFDTKIKIYESELILGNPDLKIYTVKSKILEDLLKFLEEKKVDVKIREKLAEISSSLFEDFTSSELFDLNQRSCSESLKNDSQYSSSIGESYERVEMERRTEEEGRFLFIGKRKENKLLSPFFIFLLDEKDKVYVIKSKSPGEVIHNYIKPLEKSIFLFPDCDKEIEGNFDFEKNKFQHTQEVDDETIIHHFKNLNEIVKDFVTGIEEEIEKTMKDQIKNTLKRYGDYIEKYRKQRKDTFKKKKVIENMGIYYGEINNGKRTGYGEILCKYGDKYYIGEFKEDKMEGKFLFINYSWEDIEICESLVDLRIDDYWEIKKKRYDRNESNSPSRIESSINSKV